MVLTNSIGFPPPDHTLHGHVLSRAVVVDEFECLLRCKAKTFCASSNVHPSDSEGNRICELNRNTKFTNPADLKSKKGSTYYGSVQVSFDGFRCQIHYEKTKHANSRGLEF